MFAENLIDTDHELVDMRERILLGINHKFVEGKTHTMMLFGSKMMLHGLVSSEIIIIDATFKTCPAQFKQVCCCIL